MRALIIMGLSTLLTAIMIVIALTCFRYTMPPLVVAFLSWPFWFLTIIFVSGTFKGHNVDLVAMQTYNNINQIKQNTNRIP